MAFPSDLDDLSTSRASQGTDPLSTPDHLVHHVAEDTATQSLEVKVGIDDSAVDTTLDYLLKNAASLNPGHAHNFLNAADNLPVHAVYVDAAGQVGIGTETPAYKVDVDGVVNATGLKINDVDVGTSTDTYWNAVAGGISYASGVVIGGGTLADSQLKVIKTSSGAETVPFAIQNADLAHETAIRIVMAATTSIGSDTNGLISFLGTRKADGGMNLDLIISPGGGNSPISKVLINGSSTGLTASTENSTMTITTDVRQWEAGALAIQRDVLITQPRYSFEGASTLTDAATFAIAGAPRKSTNATITNTHALLIQSGVSVSTATNSYGLTVNAPTGASNNYSAQFLGGNVGFGLSSPVYRVDVSGDINLTGVYRVAGAAGVAGSFTTTDGKTVTVTGGIITAIV